MSEVNLQSERLPTTVAEGVLARIPADIEFPRSLQVACVLLVMEEITLDQFINCLISEVEFDGTGQKLASLMTQMKVLVKESSGYFDICAAPQKLEFKANMFIIQLMTELHIKFVNSNVQQKVAQRAQEVVGEKI